MVYLAHVQLPVFVNCLVSSTISRMKTLERSCFLLPPFDEISKLQLLKFELSQKGNAANKIKIVATYRSKEISVESNHLYCNSSNSITNDL